MPTISVIVPVYKVEKYIHRCVDSILGQTYADFELILVDDGSPDNCGDICDEYAAKDSRVVVIHQENGGLSAARNAGIDWAFANSGSQWLTFVDSDDWVHPEYLQRLLGAALEHNVSVSICGYAETEGQEPEIIPENLKPVIWNIEEFYVAHNVNATVAWGKLYRKTCFQNIRYPVGKIHEDEYVTYRILFQFETISIVLAPLYAYFYNSEGITKKPWSGKRLDVIEAIDEQLQFFEEFRCTKAFNVRIVSYFQEITNILKYASRVSPMGVSHKIMLHKKRLQVFHRMNFAQRSRVCNELHPRLMGIYWRIYTGVRMVFRGEWKSLLRRIKNKIRR